MKNQGNKVVYFYLRSEEDWMVMEEYDGLRRMK